MTAFLIADMIVSVTDSGPGITVEELPKIFDRFHKGQTSGGSGLGLTIARNLIQAHGGEIRADNIPGNGASFHRRSTPAVCFTSAEGGYRRYHRLGRLFPRGPEPRNGLAEH